MYRSKGLNSSCFSRTWDYTIFRETVAVLENYHRQLFFPLSNLLREQWVGVRRKEIGVVCWNKKISKKFGTGRQADKFNFLFLNLESQAVVQAIPWSGQQVCHRGKNSVWLSILWSAAHKRTLGRRWAAHSPSVSGGALWWIGRSRDHQDSGISICPFSVFFRTTKN